MATEAQTPVLCELCDSDNEVNFYCVTCGLVLCSRCRLAHSRVQRTKHDEVISLTEARHQKKSKPTVTLCNDHPTQEVSLFCEQCNQFICIECLDDKHQEHKIMSSKKIKSKRDKLVKFMDDLKNKKEVFTKALDNENDAHTLNTRCYDQIRTDISDQVNKIIEEVTSLGDEKFTELSTLQEKENQRHSDVLTSLKSNTEVLTSAIDLIQTGIDSGNPITMERAESNARHSVQNVDVPPEPTKVVTKYKPGNINRPAVMPLFGDMIREDSRARPKQQYLIKFDIPHPPDVIQRKIDVNNVRTASTIHAQITKNSIRGIVPISQDTSWVSAAREKQVILTRRDGATVRTSVHLCDENSYVMDAKQYNNDLLVTCWRQHDIIRLSEDGRTKTTFCDMSPYYPLGLCITYTMDVLLCLKSTLNSNDHDAKVIRLNSNGDRIQSIQRDDKGDLLYSWPYSVTSLHSGEVIVCDRGHHMRVSCVNSEGHLMFTWSGEAQGRKVDKFDPACITHDKYNNLFITDCNNHRVCVLSKDGTEAKCLVDSTQGIQSPLGIAVDGRGQLWVGCTGGKIQIIEYRHTVI